MNVLRKALNLLHQNSSNSSITMIEILVVEEITSILPEAKAPKPNSSIYIDQYILLVYYYA